MLVVIPLDNCISRPGEGSRGLITHLEAVAQVCGDSKGSLEEKLAFLAGLAHDAAKAAKGWQEYIREPQGQRAKGPPHAPLGAGLFAFWADRLIPSWCAGLEEQEKAHDLALDWVRMIYRHHGALDDLETDPPWGRVTGSENNHDLLTTCDRAGLDRLVRTHFPDYDGSLFGYDAWEEEYADTWGYRVQTVRAKVVREIPPAQRDLLGMRLARLGGCLIFADRLHAAKWKPDEFCRAEAERAVAHHEAYCAGRAEDARKRGASEGLIQARKDRQQDAVTSYLARSAGFLFSLQLPTGYGKTLTGLRVALEAIRTGRCKRLIYVAPYISILSQNAGDIEKATGDEVFVHHHLSILESKENPKADRQAEDHQPYDLMDSWQAPILATTFNQLFRALFPSRAQECVRQAALDGAFLFIDEPQIVDVKVWCAFLRALRLVCEQRGAQALFSTATMPPMADGVGNAVVIEPLVSDVSPIIHRYTIHAQMKPWTISDTAEEANCLRQQRGSVACILNTVRDAVEVFRAVGGEKSGWRFLAAMMLPGHKAKVIKEIEGGLNAKVPVGVICTQVLEAGVDLSFRSILRARPIFSSVAQAAGRANRHGEGEEAAEVVVFPFIREDGKESREYVYRDVTARTQTDQLLMRHTPLPETGMPAALGEYYEACWKENPHTGSLAWFEESARGKWTALGGLEPFGGSYPVAEVFIPGSEAYLKEEYRVRMTDFSADTAEDLLGVYRDREGRRGRDFKKRKMLSALLRQFIVSFPLQRVSNIASPVDGCDWLWQLNDGKDYTEETGLAHHLPSCDADIVCTIF